MRGLGATAIAAIVGVSLLNGAAFDPSIPSGGGEWFAAISYEPVPGDTAANRSNLERLVAGVADRGAQYAVLPALSLTGASSDLDQTRRLAERIPGPASQFFSDVARRHRVRLVTSILERAEPAGYHVATVMWGSSGEILFRRRSVMPQKEDSPAFVRGDAAAPLESVDDRRRRVGVLAGEDLQAGVPRLASRGAETILVSANWTTEPFDEWRALCERLSRAYRVNLVVAAIGPDRSLIVRPSATPIAPNRAAGAQVVYAALERKPPAFDVSNGLGLPSIPVPTSYEPTSALIDIGRELFFDKRLSRDGTVSCASCHRPERAFANGERTGQGIFGRRKHRNVPTLLNVAFKSALFWDGASATLEHQAKFPMSHRSEMGIPYLDLVKVISGMPRYVDRFKALSIDPIAFDDVARALASYERTLVSASSPFDRFYYAGDRAALSGSAQRGLQLFKGKARCVNCHSIGANEALLMDQTFHNTGVGYRKDAFTDLGLGALSDRDKSGFFLTPSLRNVALTAPYMHDGSIATLEQVVEFYDRGAVLNPYLDRLIAPIGLTGDERGDIVEFLRSLNGSATFSGGGRQHQAVFAAVQFVPSPGDVKRNEHASSAAITRAAGRGARFVVLPEHGLTGPLTGLAGGRLERLARETSQASSGFFGRLARELRIWIAVPTVEYDSVVNKFYLATLLLDDTGAVVAKSRKLVPRRELGDGVAQRGGNRLLKSIETPIGRLALLAGDDLAEGVPKLAERGARTILVSASWQRSDAVDWIGLAVSLATQYRVNLVISNAGSEESGFCAIVSDNGEVTLPKAADRGLASAALVTKDPSGADPPLGLPSIPSPTYRQATTESIERGRELFFDTRLSREGSTSCATCHDPAQAFTDGRKVARGVYGRSGTRNTPTLLNSVYRPFLAWDGAAQSPFDQIGRALHGWTEMDADYPSGDPTRLDEDIRAIGDYVRTLTSGRSPFDRYYYARQQAAIGDRARRGFELFKTKAGCVNCHQITPTYALFTDNDFHNTGVGYHPRFQYLGYAGDGLEVNFARFNNFRGEYVTPSLRNVAQTAPYMHDGSLSTLAEVVHFYNTGGVPNPFLDERIKPLNLSKREEALLVEFLNTLNGDVAIPARIADVDVRVGPVSNR